MPAEDCKEGLAQVLSVEVCAEMPAIVQGVWQHGVPVQPYRTEALHLRSMWVYRVSWVRASRALNGPEPFASTLTARVFVLLRWQGKAERKDWLREAPVLQRRARGDLYWHVQWQM